MLMLLLLLLLMPDGPAVCDGDVNGNNSAPESNGVCPYIHMYPLSSYQVYEHISHISHTRLTPAPSRSQSYQGSPPKDHPGVIHQTGNSDRALDGTADFDPSRLAPPPA
jgi:hypothetical protein